MMENAAIFAGTAFPTPSPTGITYSAAPKPAVPKPTPVGTFQVPTVIPTSWSPVPIGVPQVLPPIVVTEPGGDLFDITPTVKITETRAPSVPTWVWYALGGLAVLWLVSRRRRG